MRVVPRGGAHSRSRSRRNGELNHVVYCHELPHSAEFSTDEEALGYSLVGVIDVSLRDSLFTMAESQSARLRCSIVLQSLHVPCHNFIFCRLTHHRLLPLGRAIPKTHPFRRRCSCATARSPYVASLSHGLCRGRFRGAEPAIATGARFQ